MTQLPTQDDGKIHLTYQSLLDYRSCPRLLVLSRNVERQRRGSEDGRPRFIGYLLQAVMGDFYRHEWWRRPAMVETHLDAAVRFWSPALTDAHEIVWSRLAEREHWETVAIEAIPCILHAAAVDGLIAPTVLIERELTWAPFPGVIVHGRVDVVLLGETVTLLDLKGGRVYGRYVERDQLRLYALMLALDPDIRTYPHRVGFWWLRHGKVQWLRGKARMMEPFRTETQATIKDLLADQARGAFEAKPTPACGVCPVRGACPEGLAFLQAQRSRILVPDAQPSVNTGTFSL